MLRQLIGPDLIHFGSRLAVILGISRKSIIEQVQLELES